MLYIIYIVPFIARNRELRWLSYKRLKNAKTNERKKKKKIPNLRTKTLLINK